MRRSATKKEKKTRRRAAKSLAGPFSNIIQSNQTRRSIISALQSKNQTSPLRTIKTSPLRTIKTSPLRTIKNASTKPQSSADAPKRNKQFSNFSNAATQNTRRRLFRRLPPRLFAETESAAKSRRRGVYRTNLLKSSSFATRSIFSRTYAAVTTTRPSPISGASKLKSSSNSSIIA